MQDVPGGFSIGSRHALYQLNMRVIGADETVNLNSARRCEKEELMIKSDSPDDRKKKKKKIDEHLADEILAEAEAERNGNAKAREKKPLRRKAKPPAEYPIEALGDRLTPVAEALAEVTKAPLEACAQVLLSVVNAAVHGLADVVLPHGERPITLFTLCILPSGERKSAIFKHAMKSIREFESKLRREHARALEAAKADKNAKVPPLPFVSIQESTIDGLLKLVGQSRGTVLVATDEAAVFANSYSMAAKDLMRTCAAYSSLWDASPIVMARASTDHREVVGKRVGICLLAQHEAVAKLISSDQARAQGILGRFLMCMPESLVGARMYSRPSTEAIGILDAFHRRMLYTLEMPLPLVKDSGNELAPRNVELSDKAVEVFIEFHDEVERLLVEGKKYHPVREFAAKAAEHAVRLAATIALFHNRSAAEITAARMRDGVTLARYYLHEALRIAVAEGDPDLVLAEKTLAWLKRRDEEIVGLSEMYRLGPPDLRSAAKARKIASILVEHGYLAPIEGGAEIRGKVCEAFRLL